VSNCLIFYIIAHDLHFFLKISRHGETNYRNVEHFQYRFTIVQLRQQAAVHRSTASTLFPQRYGQGLGGPMRAAAAYRGNASTMFPQRYGQGLGGPTRAAAANRGNASMPQRYGHRAGPTRAAAAQRSHSYGDFWDPIVADAEAHYRRTGEYPYGYRPQFLPHGRALPRGRYPTGYFSRNR
jgi:hypothetical protein